MKNDFSAAAVEPLRSSMEIADPLPKVGAATISCIDDIVYRRHRVSCSVLSTAKERKRVCFVVHGRKRASSEVPVNFFIFCPWVICFVFSFSGEERRSHHVREGKRGERRAQSGRQSKGRGFSCMGTSPRGKLLPSLRVDRMPCHAMPCHAILFGSSTSQRSLG